MDFYRKFRIEYDRTGILERNSGGSYDKQGGDLRRQNHEENESEFNLNTHDQNWGHGSFPRLMCTTLFREDRVPWIIS